MTDDEILLEFFKRILRSPRNGADGHYVDFWWPGASDLDIWSDGDLSRVGELTLDSSWPVYAEEAAAIERVMRPVDAP